MTTPSGVMEERELSPLELFYDLVFVSPSRNSQSTC
jgi:low temperature requirement protein LtrA